MTELNLSTVLLTALAGGTVGVLSGLFGVGGGFLLVPLLNALLGVPLPVAVGSTTCYTLGPATTALLTRRPSLGFIELPLILAGGLMTGVFAGTTTLSVLQTVGDISVFGRSLPAVDLSVLGCYSLLMTVIAVASIRSAWKRRPVTGAPRAGLMSRWRVPPMATIPDLSPSRYSIPLLAVLGSVVGFLSGFLGMSGGLVLIPALVFFLGLRVRDATTATVVIVWIASCQACIMHAIHDRVDLWLAGALLLTGPIGARLGAELGMKLPGQQLRLGFGLMVLCAAAIVWLKLGQLVVSS